MFKSQVLLGAVAATAFAGAASAVTVNLAPENANRTRSDALTGNSETSSPDLVGNVSATRAHRSVLDFDLSSIPDNAVITSVTLTGNFNPDGSGNSANTDDGSGDLTVNELLEDPDRVNGWNFASQSFGPDQTGNTADDVAWAVAGGTLGAALSSVLDTSYDPEGIAAGTTFTWSSSAAFISAISSNLADDEVLLNIAGLGLEGGGRSFIRDNNIYDLEVEYTVIPEPASVSLAALGGLLMLRRRRSA